MCTLVSAVGPVVQVIAVGKALFQVIILDIVGEIRLLVVGKILFPGGYFTNKY